MQALSGPAAAAESAAAHTRACRAAHAPGGRWRVRGVGRLAYPPTPRTVSTPRLLPTSLACVPSPHGVVGRDVDHGQAPARLSASLKPPQTPAAPQVLVSLARPDPVRGLRLAAAPLAFSSVAGVCPGPVTTTVVEVA